MKLTKIAILGLALSSLTVFGLDDCQDVKNWDRRFASSGKLEITWDNASKAMRFTSVFGEKTKDRWLYPSISISETDQKADFLEFEIRMETNPEGCGVKNCLVLFKNPNGKNIGQIYFSSPGKEFRKIKLDLRKVRFKMEEVQKIQIGMNFKDATEGAFWLRNIAFTKQK